MKNQWFVFDGVTEQGPFGGSEVVSMSRSGQLLPQQLIRRADSDARRPASTVRGMAFPDRAEDERLAIAYVALAQRIASAIVSASTDSRTKAADLVESLGGDPNLARAVRENGPDDLNELVLCCLGHDLLYWAITAILADGQVSKEELTAVDALVKRIAREYAKRFKPYAAFVNDCPSEKFLAVFKKDKSHYGWPSRQHVGKVSTEALVGGGAALAATICEEPSNCLKRYAELVHATIRVTILADGISTSEEQAVIAQAEQYHEGLTELAASGNEEESISPLLDFDEIPINESIAKVKEPDFRRASWGMSQAEVRALEDGESDFQSHSMLSYSTRICGVSMTVAYNFVNNMCFLGAYLSKEVYSNLNSHIDDFGRIADLLETKYGTPDKDQTVWRDDLYKGDPQRYGLAVSAGHLVFNKEWNRGDTNIGLMLRGENYSVSLGLIYQSQRYGAISDVAARDNDLEAL